MLIFNAGGGFFTFFREDYCGIIKKIGKSIYAPPFSAIFQ